MSQTYKVWPLVPGLKGLNALGEPIDLTPGIGAWMDEEQALREEKAGRVQLMAGLSTQDLRQPTYETSAATAESSPVSKPVKAATGRKRRGRGTYNRRDMTAKKPGE